MAGFLSGQQGGVWRFSMDAFSTRGFLAAEEKRKAGVSLQARGGRVEKELKPRACQGPGELPGSLKADGQIAWVDGIGQGGL